jgi:hypothetical protein
MSLLAAKNRPGDIGSSRKLSGDNFSSHGSISPTFTAGQYRPQVASSSRDLNSRIKPLGRSKLQLAGSRNQLQNVSARSASSTANAALEEKEKRTWETFYETYQQGLGDIERVLGNLGEVIGSRELAPSTFMPPNGPPKQIGRRGSRSLNSEISKSKALKSTTNLLQNRTGLESQRDLSRRPSMSPKVVNRSPISSKSMESILLPASSQVDLMQAFPSSFSPSSKSEGTFTDTSKQPSIAITAPSSDLPRELTVEDALAPAIQDSALSPGPNSHTVRF